MSSSDRVSPEALEEIAARLSVEDILKGAPHHNYAATLRAAAQELRDLREEVDAHYKTDVSALMALQSWWDSEYAIPHELEDALRAHDQEREELRERIESLKGEVALVVTEKDEEMRLGDDTREQLASRLSEVTAAIYGSDHIKCDDGSTMYYSWHDLGEQITARLSALEAKNARWANALRDAFACDVDARLRADGRAAGIREAAAVALAQTGGFSASIYSVTHDDREWAVRDVDGPWVLNADTERAILALLPDDEHGPHHADGCAGTEWVYSGRGYNRVRVCACGAEDHDPEPSPSGPDPTRCLVCGVLGGHGLVTPYPHEECSTRQMVPCPRNTQ